ncbi:MAG: GtrA family protein [Thaumarchaeota archaeon]|nr:GtrA family protein [Nitrososphaerota archaeon]
MDPSRWGGCPRLSRATRDESNNIGTRYSLRGTFRFAIASMLGFGVSETVLAVGLLVLYGTVGIPKESFSSPDLIGLDAVSLVIGVSASFILNERITVHVAHTARRNSEKKFARFLKFQAVSESGNVGVVLVQLLLLATFSVTPLLGTIVGAIVTYPLVYIISIWFVWGESSAEGLSTGGRLEQSPSARPES